MPQGNRTVRVFISSASGALAAYRQAAIDVCQRLGFVPVHMEEFRPERPPPLEACRRELATCDVFILLLAHRYGVRPPGEPRSYTELEYDWALARPEMALIPFVVDPAFPWPPPDVDRGAAADALAAFVARVKLGHTVNAFGEVMAFREDLILALKPHEIAAAPVADSEPRGSAPPQPPAFHAVPAYVGGAPFTGRAADLAALDAWAGSDDPVMVVEAIGGTGKSALTWEWAQARAPAAIDDLAGRLWWSFYDGSASMTRFLRELVAYAANRPPEEIRQLKRHDLSVQALDALRQRPYLVVLDGFERLLAAYHRFDPSKLRDDEVEAAKRSLIEPHAEDVVRALIGAHPSKILISTRLMPEALEGRFGQTMPGVSHLRLPGLTDRDTVALLGRLGVLGSDRATTKFFHRLGNHPLLVGVVAGLVRDYRPEPGGFDRWLADPTAGGALSLSELDLTARRAHILEAGLAGLPAAHRQLLGWISVLAGAVDWATLDAINPFRGEPPAAIVPDLSSLGPQPDLSAFVLESLDDPVAVRGDADQDAWDAWRAGARQLVAEAERATEQARAAWRSSEPVLRAAARLDGALQDLEDRGLLWWDRPSNSYDLHPIVRAYVHDQLDGTDRKQANDRVRSHFEALPPEDPTGATSVEDLRQTLTIFRALVGADRLRDADRVWSLRLYEALLRLGACATVIELLSPLATSGSPQVRTHLLIAYKDAGRLDEALDHAAGVLADDVKRGDVEPVVRTLINTGWVFY